MAPRDRKASELLSDVDWNCVLNGPFDDDSRESSGGKMGEQVPAGFLPGECGVDAQVLSPV